MKTLYLDCFAGIASDMLVGALFELVPNPDLFKAELAKLSKLTEADYQVGFEKSLQSGISGTRFLVHTHEHHPHRGLKEIEDIILSSGLSPRIQREALRAFSLLAEAEAKVHGTTPDKIHFHEVGAIDSIVDIVGAFILIDQLGWPRVLSSTINTGSGTVTCAHGVLPVPAPATELLLHGLPVTAKGAPMYLLAWPDQENRRNSIEFIGIPGVLSFLAHGSFCAEVKGLNAYPPEDHPPVLLTFLSFRAMVGLGTLFPLLAILAWFWRTRLAEKQWFAWALILAIPLPYVAIMAGWTVAEVGRQPWIVWGMMKTADAVSPVPASSVALSILAFISIYTVLGVLDIWLLRKYAMKGPDVLPGQAPDPKTVPPATLSRPEAAGGE